MKLLLDYIALCFFTNNPNELQPHKTFVWQSIGFYLLSGIIVEANISDPADATLEVGMRAIVAVCLITSLLVLRKQWPLFTQLLTAIFICENVMMTLGIGVELFDYFVQRTPYEDIPMYLGGILIAWYLAVVAYILRQMFSYALIKSLSLALAYFMLTYGGPFLVMEVI